MEQPAAEAAVMTQQADVEDRHLDVCALFARGIRDADAARRLCDISEEQQEDLARRYCNSVRVPMSVAVVGNSKSCAARFLDTLADAASVIQYRVRAILLPLFSGLSGCLLFFSLVLPPIAVTCVNLLQDDGVLYPVPSLLRLCVSVLAARQDIDVTRLPDKVSSLF
jgi:hypothetical protein